MIIINLEVIWEDAEQYLQKEMFIREVIEQYLLMEMFIREVIE